MEYLEITLLIIAYTLLGITLFLEIVCYRRHLERWETMAFTGALLVLIIALTLSQFFPALNTAKETNCFLLIAIEMKG